MNFQKHKINSGEKVNLAKIKTMPEEKDISKDEAKGILKKNIKEMSELQNIFYAYDKYSLLLVFQAMDAAGKDSTIKKVMSGLNPQGVQVFSFQQPSKEELDHDYLWRIHKSIPERGRIGIFNRSHYEDVLVVKVHNMLKKQNLAKELIKDDIWQKRYRQINDFEKYLTENGTIILKFFLHISKDEQKKRFLKRINTESKNWKFSEADIEERKYWNDYMNCYQEAISQTSTENAPWFVVPFDKKWYGRLAVSNIIVETMQNIKMKYPALSKEQMQSLEIIRYRLEHNE